MSFSKSELAALIMVGGALPAHVMATENLADYPQRAITLIVGTAPGGGTDILARRIAAHMTEDLGQKVIVDYRPGASGNIAAVAVARSEPDGYTIFLSTRAATLHKTMYPHINYDYAHDLTPVALAAKMPLVIVMGNHVSASTLPDAISLSKSNPNKFSLATIGVGTTNYLLSRILQETAGVEWVHVPYQSAPVALRDVIAGRVEFLCLPLSSAIAHIQAGSVRAMAVMSTQRVAEVPDIPSIEELGFAEAGADDWFAVMAPARTPSQVVTRLNRSVNRALAAQGEREQLSRLGFVAPASAQAPAALGALISEDTKRWTAILTAWQIKGLQ
ncbi:tripartite tricarboxylate transporter substrate binding protein [Bordetella sp. LUAb4]|uniref:Bug family tripartite tricarboxylate transporter substrate binding protein n=1 Tax=Bordetella sp. LUAb4 TaxID=2843195 RepID=UPI001E5A0EA9|nr:tripartite tricarboxylate transporter substrate-binding protein [Bordetella sp. LUAb4]